MDNAGNRRGGRFIYLVGDQGRQIFDEITSMVSDRNIGSIVMIDDFDDLIQQVHRLAPGCVFVEADAVQLTQLAFARAETGSRALSLILVGDRIDVATVVEAMKVTSLHFLERPLDRDRLLVTLHDSLRDIDQALQAETSGQINAEHLASLTPRERSVFEGLVTGLSNKEIAKSLSISHRTVEVYRANLAAKLHSKKPTDWVRLKLGLPLGDLSTAED